MKDSFDKDFQDKVLSFDSADTEPFTDWPKEPTVAELKQEYLDAKPSHDAHVTEVERWLSNLNVTGAAKQKKKEGRSAITPMLIRKQAEWRYSSLSEPFLSTEDIFNVEPITFEDKEAAIQNALVINNQFNTKLNKVNFIDEYIRAAVDEGTVITRVGWEEEKGQVEVEVPIYEYVPDNSEQGIQAFQVIHKIMQNRPEAFSQLPKEMQEVHQASMQAQIPLRRIQVGVEYELQNKLIKNQPTLEVCDYRHVMIDPTAEGEMHNAKFIIYSFETSLADLKATGKYSNLDKINIENTSILAEPDYYTPDNNSFNFNDEPRKRIIAHEYWGYKDVYGKGDLTAFVATWVGDVMIRMEKNPFPDQKIPFVSAQYLPVRKSNYGQPDGELLEDNQRIIGAITRGMIDILGRSANGQMGMRKDALDVVNKRRFDKGLDYEFNGNVNAKDLVYMHTYPEIPRSAEFMLNLENNEAESLTGVKSFANSGITGQALGATATGIRSALDATSKRELGILRRMAGGIKEIGRKVISMNADFLSEEEVIRITNDKFIPIRRDDLAGDFDLSLTISTAEVDNEKAQEISFMMQTMGNSLPFEFTQILLTELADLRKMPTLAKKIEDYEQQPDPLEVKRAELEVSLLEAQVFNERAKGAENTQDVEYKKAKTVNEKAKARNLDSKSDNEDLAFVNKQNGVDQEDILSQKDHDRATELDLKTADAIIANDQGDSPPNSTGTI